MQVFSSKRAPLSWFAVLLLVSAGFVFGLTVAGGGGGHNAPLEGTLHTAEAVAAPAPSAAEHPSYADVAEAVTPAVVNVSTDKVVQQQGMHPFMDDPFFRRFFDIPNDQEGGRERIERSLGSGVVIDPDGYIMTNNHVVEKASAIRVSFKGNEEYEAEVVGTDPQTDLALLKIKAKEDALPFLRFATEREPRIGDQVMAVGNPFGLGHTVTVGIISALGRTIGLIDYENLIQTDATINPGNSGGALVNMSGELIGVNTAILSRSGGSQGIGFAIPASMAEKVMNALKEHGEVQRAWLGVLVQPVDQSLSEYLGMAKPAGVLVSQVNEDSPAQKAGLKEGDVILAVDGKDVNTTAALRAKVSLLPVGDKVDLTVLRDGKQNDVTVTLGELPEENESGQVQAPSQGTQEGLEGVTVRNLNERMRQMAQVPDEIEGVLVTDVGEQSAAFREGLRQGDVITQINREKVTDTDDYKSMIDKAPEGRPLLLRVYKPQQETEIFMAVPR